jgi:hypothetical protein
METISARERPSGRACGRKHVGRMLEERGLLVVRGQEPHHVRPELGIVDTRRVDICQSVGGVPGKCRIEDLSQTPMPFDWRTHAESSVARQPAVNGGTI